MQKFSLKFAHLKQFKPVFFASVGLLFALMFTLAQQTSAAVQTAALKNQTAPVANAQNSQTTQKNKTAVTPNRPNIVFIYTDDHAFQSISAYGSNRNLTPNMDRIAKEGMRFTNCCVTNSLCGPCRAVVQTGKYGHLNGFMRNEGSMNRFDNTQQTFPKLLRQAGYETAMIGKWHLNCDVTGFDYAETLIGQGPYFNPTMNLYRIPEGKRPEPEDFSGQRKQIQYQGYTTEIITDLALDWLKQKAEQQNNQGQSNQTQDESVKPFMLMCQHKAPHREWQPTPKYYNQFKDVVFPEPENFWDDYSDRGLAVFEQDMTVKDTLSKLDLKIDPPGGLNEQQLADWHMMFDERKPKFEKFTADEAAAQKAFQEVKNRSDATEEEIMKASLLLKEKEDAFTSWKYQCYMKDYLSVIAGVDESVGRILDYLDKSGLAENTIVIYASDQGFYLGEHGWFDKRFMFEESFKTSLLVRWPGQVKPETVSDAMVSNLDLAETFLDLAGAPIPSDMQGKSLVPIFKGETPSDWRTSFFYDYSEYTPSHAVKKHYGVYDGRFKLVHYYDDIDEWELYDLKNDPLEMKNEFNNPEFADDIVRLKSELIRLKKELLVPEYQVNKERPNFMKLENSYGKGQAKIRERRLERQQLNDWLKRQ